MIASSKRKARLPRVAAVITSKTEVEEDSKATAKANELTAQLLSTKLE